MVSLDRRTDWLSSSRISEHEVDEKYLLREQGEDSEACEGLVDRVGVSN